MTKDSSDAQSVAELRAENERLRAAPFACETHMCGSCKGCRAAKVRDWVTEMERRVAIAEAKLETIREYAAELLDVLDGRDGSES